MSPGAADRNLLLGIMAVQNDFVSRDALIEAMGAWVLDKVKSLGEILVERGALSPERHALLTALVAEHIKAHHDDPQRSLAAVPSGSSLRRQLSQIADADVQASLAIVGSAPPPDLEATTPETLNAPGLRYRVLRPHAKGGLGEVFVAEDVELHREVALKEIQLRHADDPNSRGRFLLEAEVTGRLEHPGIVPVYGLGQYAAGRPFYAMRFIHGDNLKEAIRRFHEPESPTRDPGERRLALRQLLGRFIDVCNAVAYAHSRGVLHRDLKPGNIMLGKYGETLVVDWGLAKAGVRGQESGVSEQIDETALRPSSGSGVAVTQMGAAIGTPAYMSPEQASGQLDKLGPASDIYSLGATLYALLTGQAPFRDNEAGDLLRKVQNGDFVPPCRLKPEIPPPLEAICLKAMSVRPEDRYPLAGSLASEIEHWLADEPVAAFPDPWTERLRRWGRRHRTAVASAAVLLVTAVLGLAAGLVAVNAERQRTEAAWAAEAQQRQKARAALDGLSSEVIDDWLARQPVLTEQQRKFLERALASYEEFAQDTSQDEQSRAGVAEAYLRVGNILLRLGKFQEAEAAYRVCQEWYAQLAADYPAVPLYRRGLSTAHHNRANTLSVTGRADEAEREYRAALELLQRLADDYPGEAGDQNLRARSHETLGLLLEHKGQLRRRRKRSAPPSRLSGPCLTSTPPLPSSAATWPESTSPWAPYSSRTKGV
jgi:serine/threonine-protein kinase